VSVVIQCPLEYGAMGATGLKYDAVKDFIKWSTPEGYDKKEVLKAHIPFILNLGSYYVGELNRKK